MSVALFLTNNKNSLDGQTVIGDRINLNTRYAFGNIPYWDDDVFKNATVTQPAEFLTWSGNYPKLRYPWVTSVNDLSGSGRKFVIQGGGTTDNPQIDLYEFDGVSWNQIEAIYPYIFRGEDVFPPSFMPIRLGKPYQIDGVYAFVASKPGPNTNFEPRDGELWAGSSPDDITQIAYFDFNSSTGEYYMDSSGVTIISGAAINSTTLTTGQYEYLEWRSTTFNKFADRSYLPVILAFVGSPVDGIFSDIETDILGGVKWTPTTYPTWENFWGTTTVRTDTFRQNWHTDKYPSGGTWRQYSVDRFQFTSEQHHNRKFGNDYRIDPRRRATIGSYPSSDEYFIKKLNNGFDIEEDWQLNVSNGRNIVPAMLRSLTLLDNDQGTIESPVNAPQYDPAATYNTGDYVCSLSNNHFAKGARCLNDGVTGDNPFDGDVGVNWVLTDGVVYIEPHIPGNSYNKGAVVEGAGNFFYESNINNNTNTPPGTGWQPWTKPDDGNGLQLWQTQDEFTVQKTPGTDGKSPSDYAWEAAMQYQIAMAHGSNTTNFETSRFVDLPDNPFSSGLLKAIHTGNEQDKHWRGFDSYFDPEMQAAHWSAVIDGHLGTLGTRHGIWNVAPDMDIWLSCYIEPRYDMFLDSVYKHFLKIRQQTWDSLDAIEQAKYNVDPINNGNTLGSGKICITFNSYPTKDGDQRGGLGADDIFSVPMYHHIRDFIGIVKSLFPNNPVYITETGYDKAHDHEYDASWNLCEGAKSNIRVPFNDVEPTIGPIITSGENRYISPYTQAKLAWRLMLDVWYAGFDKCIYYSFKDVVAIGGSSWVTTFANSGAMQSDGTLEHLAYCFWAMNKYLRDYRIISRDLIDGYYKYRLRDSNSNAAIIVHLESSDANGNTYLPVSKQVSVDYPSGLTELVKVYGLTNDGRVDTSLLNNVSSGGNRYPSNTEIIETPSTLTRGGSKSTLTVTNGNVTIDVYEMPIIILNELSQTNALPNELPHEL